MSFLAGAGASFPVWLRLRRNGDRIDGEMSADGRTWMPVGSVTMTLPSRVPAGLAVTSHDPNVLNTATFDNVSVVAGTTAPEQNLLRNAGFEESAVPALGPGWISDAGRQAPAQSETAAPRSGTKNGACRSTAPLDCGIYQDLAAPVTGNYLLTLYAAADRPGALVGVNVNGRLAGSVQVEPGGLGSYRLHGLGFVANAGDTIRVWVYSPATPVAVVIDDVFLMPFTGPR
jgi:hypothetical protein